MYFVHLRYYGQLALLLNLYNAKHLPGFQTWGTDRSDRPGPRGRTSGGSYTDSGSIVSLACLYNSHTWSVILCYWFALKLVYILRPFPPFLCNFPSFFFPLFILPLNLYFFSKRPFPPPPPHEHCILHNISQYLGIYIYSAN